MVALSDLQERKLDRAFGQLDVDRNGFIERDDLQALGARLVLGFGEAPGSVKGRSVLDSFDGIWYEICAATDIDGDGRISPQEFRAGMDSSFISGGRYDVVFQPAAEAVVALCDTDGDGVLGFEEFEEFQRAMGTTPGDGRAAFAALDRDGSGRLDAAEMLAAIRQFYTGAEETAAGNQLYGPV